MRTSGAQNRAGQTVRSVSGRYNDSLLHLPRELCPSQVPGLGSGDGPGGPSPSASPGRGAHRQAPSWWCWPARVLPPHPVPPGVSRWDPRSRCGSGRKWTILADFSELKHTKQRLPTQLFQKLCIGVSESGALRKLTQSLVPRPSPVGFQLAQNLEQGWVGLRTAPSCPQGHLRCPACL